MKLRIWVCTDRVGSKVERTIDVDPDDWKGDAREHDAYVWDEIQNTSMIEWGYEEVDDGQ